MEYYLKDIGEYNYMTDTWVYYVSANERLAKLSNSTPNIYYAYDHLGNTRIAFSPEQRPGDSTFTHHIHFAADYYPYGKILRSFESSSSQEKYFTTQHERDRETGFDYRGARYFDSDIGRFLSVDPLASQYPAWSDYNYVMGNPISLIDPDGRSPQDWIKNKSTGQYSWDASITSPIQSLPEGYEYVGKSAQYESEFGEVQLNPDGSWDFMNGGITNNNFNQDENEKTTDGGLGAGFSVFDIVSNVYSDYGHNHMTYTTLQGVEKNIYKPNGQVRSANAAKFAKASNVIRGTAVIGSVLSTGYSTYNVVNQYNSGGIQNVNGWDATDAGVGLVGLSATGLAYFGLISNPVGWAIGTGALIYGGARLTYDLIVD
jgi:RHS repeat-associated protein